MIKSQFLLFVLSGGIAAGANFGSRFIFSNFFAYGIAIILAYLVGMLVAFILMREHVFKASEGPISQQIIKFAGVNLLAVLQTLLISLLLARSVLPTIGIHDHAETLGHFLGVLMPVITSYYGHKYLTFR